MSEFILELKKASRYFGSVIALKDIDMKVKLGEVHCLLGDNGAGKSTLIKTLAGVHKPSEGEYLLDGKPVEFQSPKDALDAGIATVYQDLALVPLMSVTRNFFMGRELTKRVQHERNAQSDCQREQTVPGHHPYAYAHSADADGQP